MKISLRDYKIYFFFDKNFVITSFLITFRLFFRKQFLIITFFKELFIHFMQVKGIKSNHCGCAIKKAKKEKKSISPLFTGILIAILPKCPYCILAYSSAITMCSGTKLYTQMPGWTSYLLLVLAALTLLFILLNYRGKRTIIAATLVGAGSLLMLTCQFYTFNINHYYIGTFLLLFGVWVNASFRFFYRQWIKPLVSRLINL